MTFALKHKGKNKEVDSNTLMPAKPSPHHQINNLAMTPHDYIIHLQRTIGNQAVQRLMRSNVGFDFAKIGILQPKLKVSQPNDVYEQEADKVAEQVVRMTDPSGSVMPPGAAIDEERIVRKCVACEMKEEEDSKKLQIISRKPSSTTTTTTDSSDLEGNDEIAKEINNVRLGGGSSLNANTKDFMESRFGYDFSSVRIYTGERAALSANSIDALAYTVGNDIVFGRDQYNPSTRGGRTLLAHELAHVAQQARHQGALRIQRKEILASGYGAGRYRHGVADIAPEDWTEPDREEWEALSASGNEQMLSPGNTFMRAAWHNTLNMKPGEYQTIRERHDYYDLISYAIQHDPGTPKAVRDVRFFHATTAVTGHPGIGSVDMKTSLGLIKLGAETRQILREVNAELFALNMGIIRNLLSNWKEPRDPQNPAGPINAFDFDIRMVETEQGTVENYVTRNKARFTPSVVQEINATMDPMSFRQLFNFSHYSFEWAIEALGLPFLQYRVLDFTKREHRQAIGFASVHIFHRKSKQDYLAFMKPRVPYVRPLEGATLDVWKAEDERTANIEAEIVQQLGIPMKAEEPRAIARSRLLVNLFSNLGSRGYGEIYYKRIKFRHPDDELVNLLYSRISQDTRARIFKALGVEYYSRLEGIKIMP